MVQKRSACRDGERIDARTVSTCAQKRREIFGSLPDLNRKIKGAVSVDNVFFFFFEIDRFNMIIEYIRKRSNII